MAEMTETMAEVTETMVEVTEAGLGLGLGLESRGRWFAVRLEQGRRRSFRGSARGWSSSSGSHDGGDVLDLKVLVSGSRRFFLSYCIENELGAGAEVRRHPH